MPSHLDAAPVGASHAESMASLQESTATAAGGPTAYACFLFSLVAPGAGQIAGGAPQRGLVWLGLAAGLVGLLTTGLVHLPTTGPLDGRDAAWLGATIVLWLFASYDAWFLVRERRNAMLQHLPRTPRVAFIADLLWGGAGHVYLDLRTGLFMLPVTAAVTVGVTLTGRWPASAALLAWNGVLALRSYDIAVLRYHGTPEYLACKEALENAPLASARAPSPSLPLLTLVAGAVAVMGGFLLQQTMADLAGPLPSRPTGQVIDGTFRDPAHRLEMNLPGGDWLFEPGQTPLLLRGRQFDRRETFSLAVATAPLYGGQEVVPNGALARFATRQVGELAARLADFKLLSRAPIEMPLPGVRLVFSASERGRAKLTAQEYLLARDKIIVLTLAGPASLGTSELQTDLDTLVAGLQIHEGQSP